MNDDRQRLIEEALTAWRPTAMDGRVRGHPAWHDLDPADRVAVHHAAEQLRQMEAALDPDGLSTTGRAVLDRVLRGSPR